jgi:hypothetical protein
MGENGEREEASADVFLFIGGGVREGVVPVLHVGVGRPTACRSSRNVVQHRFPVPVGLMRGTVSLKLPNSLNRTLFYFPH